MAFLSESNLPPQETENLLMKSWCDTQVKVEKLTYIWTINSFSFCHDLESSTFSVGENDKVKWLLKLCPKGSQKKYDDYIPSDYVSLFLVLVSSDNREGMAKFKFSILNEKSEEKKVVRIEIPHNFRLFKEKKYWGFERFVKRDFLFDETNGLLPDDTLKIFCEVSMVVDTVTISGQSNGVEVKVPECELSDDLERLLETQMLSDVTLFVGDKEFRVHKAILAARSPVFAAMFEHKMAERELNRVKITDLDEEVLEEMVRFVYTGRTGDLDSVAYRLLAGADKYALERLKTLCEESICRSLAVDSAMDTLVLADLHSAVQLKARAIAFINRNLGQVMETSGWEARLISHPQLIAEIFRAIVTPRNFKKKLVNL